MRTILLVAICLSLTACGLLDPQQQQTALEVVQQMRASNAITEAQAQALIEAILSGGQVHWWEQLGTAVVSAGLAYFGIELRRGKPTQRVGLPEEMVNQIASTVASKVGQKPQS